MIYKTVEKKVRIGRDELKIHVVVNFAQASADLEAAFPGQKELIRDRTPYFGILWDSAVGLASWLDEQPDQFFSGRSFFEIGCGLALPSMVALKRGAMQVTASDFHPDVPAFLEKNLAANGLSGSPAFSLSVANWRELDAPAGDVILGSDIMYDRGKAEAVAAFIARTVGQGQAVIFDADRGYVGAFEESCKAAGLTTERETREVGTKKVRVVMVRVRR